MLFTSENRAALQFVSIVLISFFLEADLAIIIIIVFSTHTLKQMRLLISKRRKEDREQQRTRTGTVNLILEHKDTHAERSLLTNNIRQKLRICKEIHVIIHTGANIFWQSNSTQYVGIINDLLFINYNFTRPS